MRLKNLFFPLMLVLSIAVLVLYGYPAFSQISVISKARTENLAKLEEFKKKGDSADSLRSKLEAGGENIAAVYRYVPQDKKEDRIIDSLNYIATTTSGIALTEMSIEKTAEQPAAAESAATVGNPAALGTVVAPDGSGSVAPVPVNVNVGLKFVTAKLSVVGNYAELKTFLDRINGVDMYNSIKSVSIEHANKNEKKTEGENTAATTSSDVLSAEITVEFAYAAPSVFKANLKPDLLARGDFDFSPLEKMKAANQIKVPEIVVGGAGNVENPFKL